MPHSDLFAVWSRLILVLHHQVTCKHTLFTSAMSLTLYHAPASFFSQRARFALAEKNIKYKSVLVEIHGGEHLLPWYVRIHPLMTVPCLSIEGRTTLIESESIIGYVDQITPELPRFFPDEKTEEGQKCSRFLQLLKSLAVEELTMGTLMNPQYTRGLTRKFTGDAVIKSFKANAKQVRRYSEKYTDLRYEYLNKEAALLQFLDKLMAENSLRKTLDVVESVLTEVEAELGRMEEENQDVPTEEKPWLCGKNFTAADIYLATLLHRLVLVGYSYFWTDGKRPNVERYYQRVLQRPSFRTSCLYANNLFWSYTVPLMRYKLKCAMPWVLGASAVLAGSAGIYIYYQKK